VEAGAMAVRRCKKADLKRIAKATGATLLSSMANLEGISLLLRLFFSTKTI
jgi:T-complex protein 1 subunit alpha